MYLAIKDYLFLQSLSMCLVLNSKKTADYYYFFYFLYVRTMVYSIQD